MRKLLFGLTALALAVAGPRRACQRAPKLPIS